MRRSAFHFQCVMSVLSALTFAANANAQSTQPDRPIKEWLVAGTFPVDTGADRVTHPYLGDEAGAAAAEGQPVAGTTWLRVSADSVGRVNLLRVFTTQKENAAAYAFVYITSPADRTINLGLETDDDGMAWLNGVLVYHKEVARGVRETDTVTLRLARGVNRLMYKVVNRSGGFGVGGRLLNNSPDPVNDLTLSATKPDGELATGPAPFVTIGKPHLAARARLDSNGRMTIPLYVSVTRWGAVDGAMSIAFAGAQVAAPAAQGSLPVTVELPVSWTDIAAAARGANARVRATWPGHSTESIEPVSATDVLGVFSKPVLLTWSWQGRTQGDWQVRIPPVLAGLQLALDVAEFVPGSTITMNGNPATTDEREQLVICNPCRAGEAVRVQMVTNGTAWWDAPRLIVRDVGYADLVASAHYARILMADSSIAIPTDSTARRLLTLLSNSDKSAYKAAIAKLAATQSAFAADMKRDTIDLIGNSHIDAAWLWRKTETVDVVRNTWRTAVKLLDKYPDMKFAASAAQYYVWLEQYEPDLLAKIQQLVKQGRWIPVGGMWVESDVNMPTGESLAMQLLLGQRTFYRLFGKYANVGWIPDTFGYPWQLPQVFRQAGLQGFITQKLRWNDTNPWTADRNYFVWQGRDGTRMPTYIPYGYDHDLNVDRLAHEFYAQADSAATRRLLTLYGVGDHGGGPTMQMLDRDEETKRAPAFPVLRDVDPAVSLQAMSRDIAKAPTINDELYFEYHRGVQTTQAAMKQWNRRMEALLIATDAAAAIAPAAYPRDALFGAWRRTLFNQFHDLLPGSGIGAIYQDAKADYAVADSIARTTLDASLVSIAQSLDTRAPAKGARPYLVFNPTGYERSGQVKLSSDGHPGIVIDSSGAVLRSIQVGDSLLVYVPNVPAVGGTLVFVRSGANARAHAERAKPSMSNNVLETDSLRLEIDPRTGNIARLFDKRLGRDVFEAGAQANALMTMPDKPVDWDAWNIDSVNGPWSPVADSVRIGQPVDDALSVSLTVERSAPRIHAKQRYVLPKTAARVDIENTIDWHRAHATQGFLSGRGTRRQRLGGNRVRRHRASGHSDVAQRHGALRAAHAPLDRCVAERLGCQPRQ